MSKKGVTLIELLVYVVLFAVVSMLIGSQMKQLMGNYANGRQISKLQSDSRDILAMISREIRNTGLKTHLISAGTNKFSTAIDAGAYLHSDSSSFVHKEGNPGDSLTIYKVNLNDNGDRIGTDTIKYYLRGATLKRSAAGKEMDIADNVHALQFQYGIFAVDSLLMNQMTINPSDWSVPYGASKSGSMSVSMPYAINGSIRCNNIFKIAKDQRIKVKFQMSASGDFPANLDSIKCCIKQYGSTYVLASERFLINGSETKLVMPVPAVNSAILSFDFWSHGKGTIDISSAEVRRADIGEYKWVDNPVGSLKKTVKAIKIYALVRSNGNAGGASNQNLSIANINVSTTGQYAWRVVKETIEILNNGAF